MKRLEALADALAAYTGYSDPLHLLYKLRNPGGLKAFSTRHVKHESGYRAFDSAVDGFKALDNDLKIKCSGTSYSGLKAESPLFELIRVFGMKDETTRYVVRFLRKALNSQDVTEDTPLVYFLEK